MSVGQDVQVACRCGAFAAQLNQVSPGGCNRLICYCESCQRAVRELGAEDVFEPGCGTDYVQLSVGQLQIAQGAEHLAYRRFTAKGPLRWYVTCCNTPVGNTLPGGFFPTVSLIRRAMNMPEAEVGPVMLQAFRKEARDVVPDIGLGRGWPTVLTRFGAIVVRARLRGDQRRNPFLGADGKPIVARD